MYYCHKHHNYTTWPHHPASPLHYYLLFATITTSLPLAASSPSNPFISSLSLALTHRHPFSPHRASPVPFGESYSRLPAAIWKHSKSNNTPGKSAVPHYKIASPVHLPAILNKASHYQSCSSSSSSGTPPTPFPRVLASPHNHIAHPFPSCVGFFGFKTCLIGDREC